MRISTTKAHPQAKGRAVVRAYKLIGSGASAIGGGCLPEDTNSVSISACAYDGVDMSTSTRVFITFGLDDHGGDLDSLINKLLDLRDKQRSLLAEQQGAVVAGRPSPVTHDAFADCQGSIVAGKR